MSSLERQLLMKKTPRHLNDMCVPWHLALQASLAVPGAQTALLSVLICFVALR